MDLIDGLKEDAVGAVRFGLVERMDDRRLTKRIYRTLYESSGKGLPRRT